MAVSMFKSSNYLMIQTSNARTWRRGDKNVVCASFKSAQKPITRFCKDCAHFTESSSYAKASPDAVRYGYCKLFTVTDVVTGEEQYVHARSIRMKQISGVKTCGMNGDFFELPHYVFDQPYNSDDDS